MKDITIETKVKSFKYSELNEEDRALIDQAKEATKTSYSPYSSFKVGAALRLNNGVVVTGSNQENAAYPSGTCAERTALFYAGAQYPDQPAECLAIAAYSNNEFIDTPIAPCGACRQVMLETEQRFKQSMRILLYSDEEIYELSSASSLLPIQFGKDILL